MEDTLRRIAIENSDTIVQKWLNEIQKLKEKNYTSSISDDLFEGTNRDFVNVIFTSIEEKGSMKALEEFSERIINLGWPLSYITDGLQVFRRVTIDYILGEVNEADSEYIIRVLNSVDNWVEPIIRKLVNEYSGSWENILSLQRLALQELSAPLI